MKKLAFLLAVLLVFSSVIFASCGIITINENDSKCSEHADADENYVCDNCGAELEKPEHQHSDADKDHKCDECEGLVGECDDADSDHFCDYCGKRLADCIVLGNSHKCPLCGKTLSDCEVGENSHKCSTCGKVVTDCEAAENSHNCSICGKALSECKDADGDYVCDICGAEVLPENLERVEYSLNISGMTATTLTEDSINGKFTIVSGSKIRNREKSFEGVTYTQSVQVADSTTAIKVDVPGTGKLSFIVQNGSSSATTQFIKITAPDGTVQDIEFAGSDAGSPLVKIELEVTEGVWTISRGKNGGTQDIFYLDLTCIVEKSEENGFELVSAGKVNFLANQTLDVTGVKLNATFGNGKTDPLDVAKVNIDATGVDMTTAGTYPIVLSYKDYEPITYYVNVFAPQSIKLGYDAIEKLSANTSYGNGVYYNHSFKEVYFINEELDLSGLSVIVIGTNGDKTLEFRVSDYKVEGFDSSEENIHEITITAYGVEAKIDIHVCATEPTPNEDGVYQLLVDPAYLGLSGVLSGPYHVFSTVQGALDYAAHIDAAAQKEIYIAPGLYKEKLEITIPNLKLIGWGETPDEVVIEWDSLYGLLDDGGFSHTTDSTQTVAIRESAYNVTIENITISNYWNSQERMDEAGLGIERGLALLVQADRFVMKNSRLLGIQDTLELFTGRQYFENVFISGYTDFIFGTNNVTLFKNCTIHVIDTSKDDSGTAGYITAFKGSNKGAADAIVYGAIFDGCKFTADDGVMEGKTAIGRTWGAYAAVAVINSELGGHISTAGYVSSENKNKRYISMNGIHPTDSTVQFVEYNNTGAGAITEAVAGMRFLTAEEAALYVDFATIFGTINGGVTFLDPWNPESTEIIVDDRTYYYFNGTEGTSGTSYTYTENVQGDILEWNGITIDATKGKLSARGSDAQFNAGAKIIFNVEAGTLVTVITYPGYGYYTINGISHYANDTFSVYFAEATEVVIEATATSYIYQLILNPNEEAPAEATLTEIKVSGVNLNYTVGDELVLSDAVVKAYYSDNSVLTLTDYTVDSSAVNNAAAGAYDVVFSFEGKSATITVTYEAPNADPAITESIVLDFTTTAGYEAVQNNPRVTMTGSIRHNGGEIQIEGTISFDIKAGTCVTIIPYASTSYASFTVSSDDNTTDLIVYNERVSFVPNYDCTFVYTGLSNNYLCKIIVDCPVVEGKYVFGGSSEEGDVTGILESGNNINISGTCKTHSGGAQLGQDSQISFILPPSATMKIKGYDTNYGQLSVYIDGQYLEMDENACYNYTCDFNAHDVYIYAVNVGDENSPAYNKSYITYIEIDTPNYIEESTTITFGSEGNYKDSGVDFSGIQIGDNGGNNSQVKDGSFTLWVREGAIVTINGYPGYTSYTMDGVNEITSETYSFTARKACGFEITPISGNNYFYSIEILYPVVYDENTTIDLSATGANIQGGKGTYEGLYVNATSGKFADNNGGWVQVNAGTIINIYVAEGAEVSLTAHSSADNFVISVAGEVCTIICNANDYLKAITINYPVVYDKATTIDLSATGANIQGGTGVYEGLSVDATNGKFADNKGGWTQVNTGTIITFNVADGATVTVTAYSSADNFTVAIANGVCTITAIGNDYLNAINVAY